MAIMRAIESALKGGDIRGIARPRRKTFRPPPDHHPLGLEPLYPNAHRPHRGALRQRLLGLSDAGRNFRRRHGLHLRSAAEDGSPGLLAGRNESSEARLAGGAALRHGAGGLRFCRQRSGHVGRAVDRRRCADAGRILCPLVPSWLRQEANHSVRPCGARSTGSPPPAAGEKQRGRGGEGEKNQRGRGGDGERGRCAS